MSILHQIYCTHCTHGSSALSRGEGEAASQMLGYSARAASLEGDELRRYYRQIEPYLHYSLPRDATDAQKLELTAATAGRRMFFVPPRDGLSLCGQVCYRTTDCEGRPGSYFAHVLICLDGEASPAAETASPETANGAANGRAVEPNAVENGAIVLESTAQAGNGASADPIAAVDAPPGAVETASEGAAPVEAAAPAAKPALRWSVVDCLRLWNAPGWATEDSASIPLRLPPLDSLGAMCAAAAPAIDEAVLMSFLKEPGDSPDFVDPAGIVPPRWRAMEPHRRADLFGELFTAFLQLHALNKPVVLVAEPSVAALVFFGVARLLPAGAVRDSIGFSTFEAVPERVQQPLSATWVSDPEKADETLKGAWPGALVRTLGPAPPHSAPVSLYVATVLQRLRQRGWENVDGFLAALSAGRIQKGEQLDVLTSVYRAVTVLLETGQFPDEKWKKHPWAIDFLRKELGRRLASAADPAAAMKAIAGGPSHLAVIDLLTGKGAPAGTRKAVVALLQKTPAQKVLGVLKLAGLSDDDKLVVLARHIHDEGELPLGCESIRDEWIDSDDGPRKPGAVLMARLVARLPPKDLGRLHAGGPKNRAVGFVQALLRMYREKKLKAASLGGVIANMEEEAFFQLLRSVGPEFLRTYPDDEKAMGEKLAEMLGALPKHPVDLRDRLEFILVGQHLLPDEAQHKAAAAWSTCLQLIPKVAQHQKVDASTKLEARLTLLNATCRDMAKAADVAMSLDVIDETMDAAQKRDALLKIGQAVLGGVPLLAKGAWESDALLERIVMQLQHHRWPQEPLKKEAPVKKEGPRKLVGPEAKSPTSNWLLVVISLIGIVLLTAVVGAAVWWVLFGADWGAKKDDGKRPGRKRQIKKAPEPTANAGALAWHIRLPESTDGYEPTVGLSEQPRETFGRGEW